MPRLTLNTAADLAARFAIPLDRDYHTLSHAEKLRVIAAADERRYRAPKNAPGSRGRMFYQYLQRVTK